MKPASTALVAHLASEVTTLATLLASIYLDAQGYTAP
jgi:hypothetical protein